MKTKWLVLAAAVGILLLAVGIGVWRWNVVYGRAETVHAELVDGVVVLHQHGTGERLVALDARTGKELARRSVGEGQLVGGRGGLAFFRTKSTGIYYDVRTLAVAPDPGGFPPLSRIGIGIEQRIHLSGEEALELDVRPSGGTVLRRRHMREPTPRWEADVPWSRDERTMFEVKDDLALLAFPQGAIAFDVHRGTRVWSVP